MCLTKSFNIKPESVIAEYTIICLYIWQSVLYNISYNSNIGHELFFFLNFLQLICSGVILIYSVFVNL